MEAPLVARCFSRLAAPVAAGALLALNVLPPSEATARCDGAMAGAAPTPHAVPKGAKLMLVQVIFRHGARTPLTPNFWQGVEWDCCGNPFKPAPVEIKHRSGGERPHSASDARQMGTALPGGCHKGELTILGKMQAFELGKDLRQRYCDELGFLPAEYSQGDISAHTTNMARTVQTLTGVVSGLYPDVPDSSPLQVTTVGDHEEFMYANSAGCPQLKLLMKENRKGVQELLRESEEFKRLSKEIEERSDGAVTPPFNVIDLYDAFTAVRSHGKKLPEWMDLKLYADIEALAVRRINLLFNPNSAHLADVLHLGMGRLLQELVQNMESCITGSSSEKLHLFSGHDTTVVPLLAAFGMELDHWPPYASHVELELWQCPSDSNTSAYYVRVVYNGDEVTWPGLAAGEMCDLGHLTEYILARFMQHHPDIDCAVLADGVGKGAAPETAGSQFA